MSTSSIIIYGYNILLCVISKKITVMDVQDITYRNGTGKRFYLRVPKKIVCREFGPHCCPIWLDTGSFASSTFYTVWFTCAHSHTHVRTHACMHARAHTTTHTHTHTPLPHTRTCFVVPGPSKEGISKGVHQKRDHCTCIAFGIEVARSDLCICCVGDLYTARKFDMENTKPY